jgi:hypothetical protein
MKMPRRDYYPQSLPKVCFGLDPVPSLLESQEETLKRVATVKKGIEDAYVCAVAHLGEDEAIRQFRSVSRRRTRGKGKSHAIDRDLRLLRAYDEAKQRGEHIAALARRLHLRKLKLGNTPEAIAAQIRKLVKERTAHKKAAATELRRQRMAMRHEPPTLLESVSSEK